MSLFFYSVPKIHFWRQVHTNGNLETSAGDFTTHAQLHVLPNGGRNHHPATEIHSQIFIWCLLRWSPSSVRTTRRHWLNLHSLVSSFSNHKPLTVMSFCKTNSVSQGRLTFDDWELIAVLRCWLFEVDLNLYAVRAQLSDKSWSQFLCVGRYRAD